jgi:hypothetical protein
LEPSTFWLIAYCLNLYASAWAMINGKRDIYSLRYLNAILLVILPIITNEAVETELLYYKIVSDVEDI